MDLLVLVLLIVLIFGVPRYGGTWGGGYGSMSVIGLIILVVLLLWLVGGVGGPIIIHDWRR